VKNLFDPAIFDKEVSLLLEYQQDLREECSKCGDIKQVVIYDVSRVSIFSVRNNIQGGTKVPLSATLFSMVIDVILKNLDLRGNISARLKQCMAYADVVLITARTKQTVKDTFPTINA
jgi:hypothetical protein